MPDRDILSVAESTLDRLTRERDAEIERRVQEATEQIQHDVIECYRPELEKLAKIIETARELDGAVVVVSRKPEPAEAPPKAKTPAKATKPRRRAARTRTAPKQASAPAPKLGRPPRGKKAADGRVVIGPLAERVLAFADERLANANGDGGWFRVTDQMIAELKTTRQNLNNVLRGLQAQGVVTCEGATRAKRWKRVEGASPRKVTAPGTQGKHSPLTPVHDAIVVKLGEEGMTMSELIAWAATEGISEKDTCAAVSTLFHRNVIRTHPEGDRVVYRTTPSALADTAA